MSSAYYEGTPSYCGCFVIQEPQADRRYLPLVDVASHATIRNTAYTTRLTQVYHNILSQNLSKVQYTFPLRNGVSVASFKCTIAGAKLNGIVMGKPDARAAFDVAVQHGKSAGMLTQSESAADVFTTELGNVPASDLVKVEIEYVGELTGDAQIDGVRYTLPSVIMPRYAAGDLLEVPGFTPQIQPMKISVDISLSQLSKIKRVVSPSHPIDIGIGTTSIHKEAQPAPNNASVTLSVKEPVLDKDFILQFSAENFDEPTALLETHPIYHDHRALMITGMPRWELQETHPEIIFVCDRSGSMSGSIDTLRDALSVFVKSLPVGIRFNICSFGSTYQMLWPSSHEYNKASLQRAEQYIATFSADFGGTEIQQAIEGVVKSRLDMPTEVIVLTDGGIWDQQGLFDFIKTTRKQSPVRFFSFGTGNSVSTSLVEGIARCGGGFAEFAANNESFDAKLVKLLKGTLSPHIDEPMMHIVYDDEEYDIVDNVAEDVDSPDESRKAELYKTADQIDNAQQNKHGAKLPNLVPPSPLQTPTEMPALFPFTRFTAYVLLPPDAREKQPSRVKLHAATTQGPLELEIEVQSAGTGDMIHKLAARKAIQELEEGRGWVHNTTNLRGRSAIAQYPLLINEIADRESVRLGVKFQVMGKKLAYLAVPGQDSDYERVVRKLSARIESLALGKSAPDLEEHHKILDVDWNTIKAASWGAQGEAQEVAPGTHRCRTMKARSVFPHQTRMMQPDLYSAASRRAPAMPVRIAFAQSAPHQGQSTGGGSLFGQSMGPSMAQSSAPGVAGPQMNLMQSNGPRGAQAAGGLADFQMQMMLLEQSNKKRVLMSTPAGRQHPAVAEPGPEESHAPQIQQTPSGDPIRTRAEPDYQMQLKLLDQHSKKRRLASSSAEQQGHAVVEPEAKESLFYMLIRTQEFDGSWKADSALLVPMGISQEQFAAAVQKLETTLIEEPERVLATACVLHIFKEELGAYKESWELVANKGQIWLRSMTKGKANIVLDEAARVIGGEEKA